MTGSAEYCVLKIPPEDAKGYPNWEAGKRIFKGKKGIEGEK